MRVSSNSSPRRALRPLVEPERLPDLACGLGVDLASRHRSHLVGADPDHRMTALAAILLLTEHQISFFGLTPKLGNEFCPLIHIRVRSLFIGRFCPNVNGRFRSEMSDGKRARYRFRHFAS